MHREYCRKGLKHSNNGPVVTRNASFELLDESVMEIDSFLHDVGIIFECESKKEIPVMDLELKISWLVHFKYLYPAVCARVTVRLYKLVICIVSEVLGIL